MIPAYIEARIRRTPPAESYVVPGSTPVLAFGDVQSARVATIGLNPSRIEFTDEEGNFLEGDRRRLATYRSLGTPDLATAPSKVIEQVLSDCNRYFDRRPYRRWFDHLEPILQACGASYYDATACHLDLVQWATDPTWAKLPLAVRGKLITEDASFLNSQLENEGIRLLLINGSGVWLQLRAAMGGKLDLEHDETIEGLSYQATRLDSGRLLGRICVIAWSTNLQSSFGVTSKLKEEIARRVAVLWGTFCR
jgi:hypothetical protein